MLATPHVFIFDADRKLQYVGRFDDAEVKAVKSHDAKNAVEALLAGRPVPVPTTRVFGCSTKWADKQADARKSLAKWDAEPVALEPIDIDAVAKLAKNDTKKLLVVNLWATWCGPCVAELPELVTMNRMYRSRPFQFVTISMDDIAKRDEALRVLKENHVAATNYILQLVRPRQVRRGARPEMARPGPVHDRHRAGRQGPLSQERPDRPARAQAGHRGQRRADGVLSPFDVNQSSGSSARSPTTTRKIGEPLSQIEPS